VVAGNVGAADRYEYTLIGDSVNEASRLTDEAKNRHTRVLASETTIARCGDEAANWGQSGAIYLRGRARPTIAFEPGLV
jgi:class 3 adenylate cyclase